MSTFQLYINGLGDIKERFLEFTDVNDCGNFRRTFLTCRSSCLLLQSLKKKAQIYGGISVILVSVSDF